MCLRLKKMKSEDSVSTSIEKKKNPPADLSRQRDIDVRAYLKLSITGLPNLRNSFFVLELILIDLTALFESLKFNQ
jgi:hypothetical protein